MRASEVIGKPIVSAETGEKLGSVADLLLDSAIIRVVGLVVDGGLFSAEHVLPYADVTMLGRDAVVTRSAYGLVGPHEWRARAVDASRASTLKNRRVITDRGRRVGVVKDIVLQDATGRIEAYEVAASAFAGLVERRHLMPHSSTVIIGPDAIVVSERVAHAVQGPRHGK